MSLWTIDVPGEYHGVTLKLLTLAELRHLQLHAPRAVLICINGKREVAARCDDDTRMGYVAYGQPYPACMGAKA